MITATVTYVSVPRLCLLRVTKVMHRHGVHRDRKICPRVWCGKIAQVAQNGTMGGGGGGESAKFVWPKAGPFCEPYYPGLVWCLPVWVVGLFGKRRKKSTVKNVS